MKKTNYNQQQMIQRIASIAYSGDVFLSDFFYHEILMQYFSVIKEYNLFWRIWGGAEETERSRILVSSAYLEFDKDLFNITPLQIVGKFLKVQPTHRNYLGALMSFGIKREQLGDLIIRDHGCIFFVNSRLATYLIGSEVSVGHVHCVIEEISDQVILNSPSKTVETVVLVSSLRLDAIISAVCGISRAKSGELIKSNLIKINQVPSTCLHEIVSEHDVISVRKYGKFKIGTVLGMSKKGKIKLNVLKYV